MKHKKKYFYYYSSGGDTPVTLDAITVPYDTSFAELEAILQQEYEGTAITWTEGSYVGSTAAAYELSGTAGATSLLITVTVSASALADAFVFYQADKQTEADEGVITTFIDQAGNHNGTGVNSPALNIEAAGGNNVKSYRDDSNVAADLNTPGTGILDTNNQVFEVFATTDGRMASGIQFFGSRTADTNITAQQFIGSGGAYVDRWGYGTGNLYVYTLSDVFADGELPVQFISRRLEAGVELRVNINRRLKSGSFTTGNLAEFIGANYNNTADIHLLNVNANGSLTTNTSASHLYALAITPLKSDAEALEIEKQIIRGMYKAWKDEFNVTPTNAETKRAAIIDYIFNGDGIPVTTNFEDRTLNYVGATMHEIVVANLVGDGQITRLRHDMTDGNGEVWRNFTYFIRNSGTWNGKVFIDHKGHGSEGPTTHENLINDMLADGFAVLLVAMPRGDNTNTDNDVVGDPYIRNHEDLYNEGVDTVSYCPLELFWKATIRAISHINSDSANYGTITDWYAAGLSGGGYSVTVLGAILHNVIKRTYCFRGIKPTSAKYYPFVPSTQNNDYEQNPANGLDTNCGPRNFAFWADHTVVDMIALATTGGRKYMMITHTEDTAALGGYTYFAWETAMEQRAIELGGEYELFMNTTTNQEAHLYQAAERAAMFADLP